jgi:hypothetical protein
VDPPDEGQADEQQIWANSPAAEPQGMPSTARQMAPGSNAPRANDSPHQSVP